MHTHSQQRLPPRQHHTQVTLWKRERSNSPTSTGVSLTGANVRDHFLAPRHLIQYADLVRDLVRQERPAST